MNHIVEALEARCLLAIAVDESFGDHGVVSTQFPAALSVRANDLAVQSDGKTIMVGRADFPGRGAFALTRLNSDGSLDSGFGDGGRVITEFADTEFADACCRDTDGAFAVAIQDSGKILVAGTLGYRPTVVRYLPNGSIDKTFGEQGIARVEFRSGWGTQAAYRILRSSEKILIAGQTGVGDSADIGLAQLNSDGTPDTTFGTGGVTSFGIGERNSERFRDAVLLPRDKIAVLATSHYAGSVHDLVLRFNSDGTLDRTFSRDGAAFLPFHGTATTIAAAGGGRLLLGGTSNGNAVITRYRRDSSVDRAFATNGRVITPIGRPMNDLILQRVRGGRFTALAKSIAAAGNSAIAALQYASDGTLLHTSDASGITLADMGADNIPMTLRLDANSNLIAAGYSRISPNTTQFHLTRFSALGAISAQQSVGFTAVQELSFNTALTQPDGKTLAIGTLRRAQVSSMLLARYERSGAPDSKFGNGGEVIVPNDTDPRFGTPVAIDAQLQPDGKIVVLTSADGTYDFVLHRFNPDGSPDASFAPAGKLPLPRIQLTSYDTTFIPYDLAIQPDGKFLILGSDRYTAVVARYNPNGSFDPSFGAGGFIAISIMNYNDLDKLVLQADGKIIVSGTVTDELAPDPHTPYYIAILRLNHDGTRDSTFGDKGLVTQSPQKAGYPGLVKLMPDGKYLVRAAGATYYDPDIWVRYNNDGSVDSTFQIVDDEYVSQHTIIENGRMIGLGFDGSLELVQYTPEGNGFMKKDDFKLNADFSLVTGRLLWQGDGKAMVVGDSSDHLVLARFNLS